MSDNFITQWSYTYGDYVEYNSGEIITDSTGYVPAHKQIQSFINAGTLLEGMRAFDSAYEVEGDNFEIDELPVSPFARKSTNLQDIRATEAAVYERLRAARESEFRKRKARRRTKDSESNTMPDLDNIVLDDTTPKESV